MNRSNRGSYDSGYSRDGGEIADELRELMEKAPNDQARMEIERLANKMEQM